MFSMGFRHSSAAVRLTSAAVRLVEQKFEWWCTNNEVEGGRFLRVHAPTNHPTNVFFGVSRKNTIELPEEVTDDSDSGNSPKKQQRKLFVSTYARHRT